MSVYASGAPTYDDADLQKFTLKGRLEVARNTVARYAAAGDKRQAAQWSRTVDELLDRLLEVRGR